MRRVIGRAVAQVGGRNEPHGLFAASNPTTAKNRDLMFRYARVSGFAVAGILLAASTAFADPLMAFDVEAAPVTTSYIDHSVAEMDGSALTAQILPESGTDFASPTAAGSTAGNAPVSRDYRTLHDMVTDYAAVEVANAEQDCLARAVYFEAKGEPLEGQLAVAEVILNRTESGRYPSSICGVVKQKSQFSFVRNGRIPSVPTGSKAWRTAVAIAHVAQNDLAESAGSDAMFFHANYVRPGWRGLTRIASLGNHIFYR
jgi:Cell wall hydrolyses involved in spore germination